MFSISALISTSYAISHFLYFFPGMPVENGKAQQRREKLSLRKELKRKCQEICVASTTPKNNVEINTPKNNMEMHSHGTTIPFSQGAGTSRYLLY